MDLATQELIKRLHQLGPRLPTRSSWFWISGCTVARDAPGMPQTTGQSSFWSGMEPGTVRPDLHTADSPFSSNVSTKEAARLQMKLLPVGTMRRSRHTLPLRARLRFGTVVHRPM